jgi:uncharacterized protein with HEPN domain
MNEGTLARLEDILGAIEGLERAAAGRSLEQYRTDWLLRMATERAIEIISEASRHIPPALKDAYPYPHWREVAAIGNVLRHAYHSVNDEIIWSVLNEHLPPFKIVITRMISDLHRH